MNNQPNDDRGYAAVIASLSALGLVVISKTEFETLRNEVTALNLKFDAAVREGKDTSSALARENDGLKHRIGILRTALSYYANPVNWTRGARYDSFKERPGGQTGRDALKTTE